MKGGNGGNGGSGGSGGDIGGDIGSGSGGGGSVDSRLKALVRSIVVLLHTARIQLYMGDPIGAQRVVDVVDTVSRGGGGGVWWLVVVYGGVWWCAQCE